MEDPCLVFLKLKVMTKKTDYLETQLYPRHLMYM
jgi:hypothetical protein